MVSQKSPVVMFLAFKRGGLDYCCVLTLALPRVLHPHLSVTQTAHPEIRDRAGSESWKKAATSALTFLTFS